MRKYVAELIGTFMLVFFGCGAIVLARSSIGNLGAALSFGLAAMAMVYAVGPISGGHLNPAVTIGMLANRRMSAKDAGGYVAGQILGALAASWMLWLIAGAFMGGMYNPASTGFGANGYGEHSPGQYPLAAVLAVEIVLSAMVMWAYLCASESESPRAFGGVLVGTAYTLVHLVGLPITLAGVNPARSIGTAVFVGGWAMTQVWAFILAPIVGAVAVVAVHTFLNNPDAFKRLTWRIPFRVEDERRSRFKETGTK